MARFHLIGESNFLMVMRTSRLVTCRLGLATLLDSSANYGIAAAAGNARGGQSDGISRHCSAYG